MQPPDIVVEILSPSSQQVDRVRKMALYARSGVPEYWIADPENRTLVIHVLAGEEYVAVTPEVDGSLASRALRGLLVDPSEVFGNLG